MNPLTYETKRAHWRATWHAINAFRERGALLGEPLLKLMTPARFDVLYATWAHHGHERSEADRRGARPERRIAMQDLRNLLGLAGSTVSRLAHRLADLKLVLIVRDSPDRRAVSVVLTSLGVRALALAIDWIGGDEHGMRRAMEGYVEHRESDGLSREGTPEMVHRRRHGRLCAIIDRTRRLARFFYCRSTPIFDPRFVDPPPNPEVFRPYDELTECED